MYSAKEKARAYHREWYHKNKGKRLTINKTYKDKLRMQYKLDKEAQPCMDCNISYPWFVMQYDHLRSKLADVSTLVRNASGKKLREEIAKCDLVCANCHAIRTYNRRTSIGSDAPAL